jgi:hypothetical protein
VYVDIGEVIGGGFRILRDKPLAVVVWAIVYLAMFLVMGFTMGSIMTAEIQAMSNPERAGAAMAAMAGPFMLFFLLSLIVYVVLFAAVQRAVLKPAQQGFFYLRLGMDELRMLALTILFLVVYYLALIALVVLSAVIGAATGSAGAAVAMVLLVFVGMIVFTAWYFVRFGLAFPLTILREKIVIGEAWRITRGRFWPLFAASLVVFVIMMLLWTIVSTLLNFTYFQDLAQAQGNPVAIQQAMQAQMARQFSLSAASLAIWVPGAVIGAISITLWGGAAATAVRLLTFNSEEIAETFA